MVFHLLNKHRMWFKNWRAVGGGGSYLNSQQQKRRNTHSYLLFEPKKVKKISPNTYSLKNIRIKTGNLFSTNN